MRRLLPLLLVLAGCAQTPADTARAAQSAQAAQVGLDKALAGLTPRSTSACLIDIYPPAHIEAYGSTLLYRVGRGLVYRNNTTGGCERVARGDILVTRQVQGRPCRGDIATTVDRVSRILTGSCALGEFTTYRRP